MIIKTNDAPQGDKKDDSRGTNISPSHRRDLYLHKLESSPSSLYSLIIDQVSDSKNMKCFSMLLKCKKSIRSHIINVFKNVENFWKMKKNVLGPVLEWKKFLRRKNDGSA
uniref:Uncharacterized protein n=1 Tax=Romanomermis culicivorax TaxID=13658 RepID=A0A915HPA9_ROMCU